jgi:hypothetical protein
MFQPGTGFYSVRPDQNLDPSENAPGDPRLGLKLRVFEGGGWAGAIQAVLHAPSATRTSSPAAPASPSSPSSSSSGASAGAASSP